MRTKLVYLFLILALSTAALADKPVLAVTEFRNDKRPRQKPAPVPDTGAEAFDFGVFFGRTLSAASRTVKLFGPATISIARPETCP